MTETQQSSISYLPQGNGHLRKTRFIFAQSLSFNTMATEVGGGQTHGIHCQEEESDECLCSSHFIFLFRFLKFMCRCVCPCVFRCPGTSEEGIKSTPWGMTYAYGSSYMGAGGQTQFLFNSKKCYQPLSLFSISQTFILFRIPTHKIVLIVTYGFSTSTNLI